MLDTYGKEDFQFKNLANDKLLALLLVTALALTLILG